MLNKMAKWTDDFDASLIDDRQFSFVYMMYRSQTYLLLTSVPPFMSPLFSIQFLVSLLLLPCQAGIYPYPNPEVKCWSSQTFNQTIQLKMS